MVFYISKLLPTAFHRNKSTTKEHKEDDTLSTSSTIAPSKSRAINSFLSAFSTEKYMSDPMRTTNRPEVVGYYYDPMSCGYSPRGHVVSAGYDCTNTGA